jgi:hypothetical protein
MNRAALDSAGDRFPRQARELGRLADRVRSHGGPDCAEGAAIRQPRTYPPGPRGRG